MRLFPRSALLQRHARRWVVAAYAPVDYSGTVRPVPAWRGVLPSGEVVTRSTVAGLVAAGVPSYATRTAARAASLRVRYALDGLGGVSGHSSARAAEP